MEEIAPRPLPLGVAIGLPVRRRRHSPRAAADLSRAELVTELMRLVALPGERDGHTAIYPFDAHAKTLHVYPLRLYDFADGLHVVGSLGGADLTGRRLTAIAGRPIAEIVELVRPLVPHDNESGRRWLLPEYVATAEVLAGLGIVEGPSALFAFADGTKVELTPVPAARGRRLARRRSRAAAECSQPGLAAAASRTISG